MSRTRSSLAAVALLAVLMLLSVAMPAAAQSGAGRDLSAERTGGTPVVSSDINLSAAKRANGTISVIVKLASAPSYRAFEAAGGRGNRGVATSAADAVAAQLRAEQASFTTAATALGGRVTNSFQFLLNAVVVEIAPERVLSLAKIPGVVAIGPNRTYAREHTTSMPLVRASDVWSGSFTGGSYTGAGVTVAVIDEGIDYSHADFGGTQNYAVNDPLVIDDNFSGFPPVALPNTATREMKVIGGYDYVGDDYDAASTVPSELIANPDPDPMGCPYAHGTHVAGTIAGYGVDAAGDTFTGAYTAGDGLFPSYPNASTATWRIGPGSAPEAYLVSLRVFGCSGSVNTDILLLSFEAAGANDYLGEDVDVVNLSLGSAYGGTGPDDFMNGAQEALAEIGVVVVASAGNSGDFILVNGAPSSAKTTISVANITDSAAIVDGQLSYVDPVTTTTVNVPAAKAVSMYTTDMPDPLTKEIVIADVANGCSALTGTYTDKWVIVDRGTCGFSIKVANVKLAGGAGAIIANNAPGAPFGPGQTAGYDDQLPTAMISQSDGVALKAAINAGLGAVSATFNGGIGFAVAEDSLIPSTSTSRGGVLRGNNDLILKPNISAPGTTITSAGAGTNDLGYTISGTSMSAPHVAGGVALLIDAFGEPVDGAGVALIKQRLMNTATADLIRSVASPTPFHSPQRVGAGFADFVTAITTNLVAYATDAPENVSLSFGYPVAPVGTTPVITKTITVKNLSGTAMVLNTSYSPRSDWGGAIFSVSPAVISIPASSSATINVTLTLVANQANLNVGGDPLFSTSGKTFLHEESGYVTLTPTSGAQTPIRVAVYAAPRLTSDMVSASEVTIAGDTGAASLALSGNGFVTGGDSNDDLSLVSAYTLLASDPEETDLFWDVNGDGSTADPAELMTDFGYADVEYLGASLNYDALYDVTYLTVGVKMYDEWTSPRDLYFEVYVDVNNDDTDDYVWYYGTAASDTFSVSVVSLANGAAFGYGDKLNYFDGSIIDSMLLKNNVVSVPVIVQDDSYFTVAARPNYAGGPIGVRIETYQRDTDYTFPIDIVSGLYTPSITLDQNTPSNVLLNVYADLDGESIPFSYDVTDLATLPEILTLHHHNSVPSERAQITSLAQITGTSFNLSSPVDGSLFRASADISAATWTELTGATNYTFTLTQVSSNTGVRASGDQVIISGTAAASDDYITCVASVCTLDLSTFFLEDGVYSWSVSAGEFPNLIEAGNNAYGFTLESDGLNGNLLLNSSFETAGTKATKALDWSSGAGVVRKTTAGGAQSGTAFVQLGYKKSIKQTLTVANQPVLAFLTTGDVLDLSFYVKRGKGKLANLTITYADLTTKKCTIASVVNTTPATDWELEGMSCTLTGPVTKIVLQLKQTGGTQTQATSYDNVSLSLNATPRTRGGALPLPAAPDGFRGNN